jgi:hypothetical protein
VIHDVVQILTWRSASSIYYQVSQWSRNFTFTALTPYVEHDNAALENGQWRLDHKMQRNDGSYNLFCTIKLRLATRKLTARYV